jgi:excisionase family DNA binding protein
MSRNSTNHAVFTLAEASKFLNIRSPVLQKLAEQGRVPGRKVGKSWRFSRSRLDKWLRNGIEPEIALLQMAGISKDDPDLLKFLDDIYKARGRPECEED